MTGLYLENVKTATLVLKNHKLRAFLTIIGVIIGVATITTISSIISGIQVSIEKQVRLSGSNTIYVSSWRERINRVQLSRLSRMHKPLSVLDSDAISKLDSIEISVPAVNLSNPSIEKPLLVEGKDGNRSTSVKIIGTNRSISKANNEIILEGRWFTEAENFYKKDVVVINSTLAEDFFSSSKTIGQKMKIGGRSFRVIGVLEKRAQISSNILEPRKLYIPINSGFRLNPSQEDLYILAVAKPNQLSEAKSAIEELLRVRRGIKNGKLNNFRLGTATKQLKRFNALKIKVFILMISISSIALLIGGIGVMNIMLVSVTARTREIGLRKTVGATFNNIMLQFLVESAIMTCIGGLLGILLGWCLTLIISLVFPSQLSIWSILAGLIVSITTGIIFGLFPAWKAAKLDPIAAIRFE